MSTITPQAVFNAAWAHFVLADNKPAKKNGKCCYLTDDGRKCAVGLCIPDGHSAQKQDMNARALANKYPDIFEKNMDWWKLQEGLHDDLCFDELSDDKWSPEFDSQEKRRAQYIRVATDFNLTIPPDPTV